MTVRPDDAAQPIEEAPSTDLATDLALETTAKAPEEPVQRKRWQMRGAAALQDLGEASEVRSLTSNEEARAQAEESMRRITEKQNASPRRRRW